MGENKLAQKKRFLQKYIFTFYAYELLVLTDVFYEDGQGQKGCFKRKATH